MELTGKKQPLESYVLFSSVFKAKVPGLVLPDSAILKQGTKSSFVVPWKPDVCFRNLKPKPHGPLLNPVSETDS